MGPCAEPLGPRSLTYTFSGGDLLGRLAGFVPTFRVILDPGHLPKDPPSGAFRDNLQGILRDAYLFRESLQGADLDIHYLEPYGSTQEQH